MTAREINSLVEHERIELAQRVRWLAGDDRGFSDDDLDMLDEEILEGRINRMTAHYITSLGVL